MIKLKDLIIENRVDDFKEKYKSVPPEIQDQIIDNDPSHNYKYLDWIGRIITTTVDLNINTLFKAIYKFDKYQAQMGDIYQYKTLDELINALKKLADSKKEKPRDDAEFLIDTDDFLVVAPKSHDACRYYGSHTQWCIVGSENWWDDYYYNNSIIIVIDRRDKNDSSNNEKYAIVGTHDQFTIYDKNDHTVANNAFTDPTSDDYWPDEIYEAIDNYMYSDDIDARKDKIISEKTKEYLGDDSDSVWNEYLDTIHAENDLDRNDIDLQLFYNIANKQGLKTDDLYDISYRYVYNAIFNDMDVTNPAFIPSTTHFYNCDAISDNIHTIKQIELIYLTYVSGKHKAISILQNTLGEYAYNMIERYFPGFETILTDAYVKYNNMLNSQHQLSLSGLTIGKETVKINNIQNVIDMLNKTGYNDLGYYLENLIR